MSFVLTALGEHPAGFVRVSMSRDWERWITAAIPEITNADVRNRMVSNLKHILVGLEMKAALIVPHALRGANPSLLFEPYCQVMAFEFCVGTFSVCEGLGSLQYLASNRRDGAGADRVRVDNWIASLAQAYDPDGEKDLEDLVRRVKNVRNRLHQDQLGLRDNIDWHAFDYDNAFVPAITALGIMFRHRDELIPEATNLFQRVAAE